MNASKSSFMPRYDRKGIKTNMIGTRAQMRNNIDYSEQKLKDRKFTHFQANFNTI